MAAHAPPRTAVADPDVGEPRPPFERLPARVLAGLRVGADVRDGRLPAYATCGRRSNRPRPTSAARRSSSCRRSPPPSVNRRPDGST
jgi:hypothetical protein